MAKKFLVPIDLTQQELQNARIQNLASAPGSPVEGQIYYNTTTDKLMLWANGAWVDFLARANHTGTQLANTISNFDTQVRTSRLDQMAAPTAAVSLNSQKITNLATPTADGDAATKAYVDAARAGLDVKDSVRAASVGNLTLSGTQTVDGVALIAGERVLVKDQSTGNQNGIYVVAAGAWTRATDADSNAEVTPGMYTFVEEGTVNADTGWVLTTNAPITLGTTALTFVQFSGAGSINGGAGLVKTGNTLDVGEGVGINVTADAVEIDTAVVARKFTATVGDGAAVAYVINHALGNQWVTVQVFLNSGTFEQVYPDIELTDANNATLRFGVAPTAAQYRVVVIG